MGTAQVVMPENYIAMFSVPSKEGEADNPKAEAVNSRCGAENRRGEAFPLTQESYDRLMSDTRESDFLSVCVRTRPFRADDKCIGCGKCVKALSAEQYHIGGRQAFVGRQLHSLHGVYISPYCPTEAMNTAAAASASRRYRARIY